MAESEYKRILMRHAKKHLAPLGCFRHGPNLWILDKSYWLALIEFQPNKWGKSSFLNAGAHWLWSHQGHFSYNYSRRGTARVNNDYVPFESPQQYDGVAENMAQRAAVEVEALCEDCGTMRQIADGYIQRSPVSDWGAYHGGITAALSGRVEAAKTFFLRVPIGLNVQIEWQRKLTEEARELLALLETPEAFVAVMRERVEAARTSLKLPAQTINFVP
jgi:hypothetical protein